MKEELVTHLPPPLLKHLHSIPQESFYSPKKEKRLALFEDKRHTLNSLRVLIALDAFCMDKNICWPSHQTLGVITHLKPHKLSAAIKKLKNMGIVEKHGRNLFLIHYDFLPENGHSKDIKLPESSHSILPKNGHSKLPESGNCPIYRISKNKKKEKESPPTHPKEVFSLQDFSSQSHQSFCKKRSNSILLNPEEQAIFDVAMKHYNNIARTRRCECEPLKERIREGKSLQDILQILENQRWKIHDEFHCKNFVPETLFHEAHWDKYLNPPQWIEKEKNGLEAEVFERRAI